VDMKTARGTYARAKDSTANVIATPDRKAKK
jgi:hypothetical protein